MREIRATANIDPEAVPAFFDLLANAPEIEEARVLEINTTVDGIQTVLFAIDGDTAAFAAEAAETPGVDSVEVADYEEGPSYALLVMRPLETPLFDAIHRGDLLSGFVVRTPIIYRDGAMQGRIVGDTEGLQRAVDDSPDAMDIDIEEIGRFRGRLDGIETMLSERQREAVEAAIALGYYEQPREATQADVAAELDCSPQTVGTHLRKAEAKVMQAVLSEF